MNLSYARFCSFLISAIFVCMLTACGGAKDVANVATGGTFNGASGRQVQLAKQARVEMCCSVTIVEYTELRALVNGCGLQSTYVYTGTAWSQESLIPVTGWGSAVDRLPVCTQ
jgi:hypothetical protein